MPTNYLSIIYKVVLNTRSINMREPPKLPNGERMEPNKVYNSTREDKKKMVFVVRGDKSKLVHFGQKGYGHNYSEAAKKSYLARSAGITDKSGRKTAKDPFSANYWARKILWPKGPTTGPKSKRNPK